MKVNTKERFKMSPCKKISKGEEKISLVGLGYVDMPVAVVFAEKILVDVKRLYSAK